MKNKYLCETHALFYGSPMCTSHFYLYCISLHSSSIACLPASVLGKWIWCIYDATFVYLCLWLLTIFVFVFHCCFRSHSMFALIVWLYSLVFVPL